MPRLELKPHVPHRLQHQPITPPRRLPVAAALRKTLVQGYRFEDFRHDAVAGLIVGLVALPLSMALAIASGVAPQQGLYTAIVAGFITALLGGSKVQVSGPTAAFVVLLAPVAEKFGLGGLALASLMAGVLLVIFGLARFGKFIEFIPYPVVTGFTSGIAVVIATLQVRDFLGLTVAHMPDHYIERVGTLVQALPTARLGDCVIGAFTLLVLVWMPRITRRVPAPLIALLAAALLGWLAPRIGPRFDVLTIGDRFPGGIPRVPPSFGLPWHLQGPNGAPLSMSMEIVYALAGSAFAIAMLGAIESLLSAVVADAMTGRKHDPDSELFAQGVANVVAPFFGGFAATGAIARTATNIRSGARSPFAAMIHALFVLAAVLLLAPLLSYLPMSALAALLLVVAWNMAELKHVLHVLRIAPRSDVLILLACFGLTVIFDMVVAVSVGVVLAAVLFMQRMAEVTGVRLVGDEHPALQIPLPRGVIAYDVAGPLFFGAAQKAMSALQAVHSSAKCVVLNLQAVPVIDATGLVNLESALARLKKSKTLVILAGVQPAPAEVLARAGIVEEPGRLMIRGSFESAVALARAFVAVQDPAEPVGDGPASSAAP